MNDLSDPPPEESTALNATLPQPVDHRDANPDVEPIPTEGSPIQNVAIPESDDSVAIAEPDETVAIPKPDENVAVPAPDEPCSENAELEAGPTEGSPIQNVAIPEPDANVAVPEPDASVAVPKPDASVAVPEPAADVAVSKPDADVAVTVPEDNVAVPEPEANVAVPEPEANVAVPEPEANVAVPEPEANVAVPEQDENGAISEPDEPRRKKAKVEAAATEGSPVQDVAIPEPEENGSIPGPEEPGPEENGAVLEPDEPCRKKAKVEGAFNGELKRVAEIVLVLSTMATMRAGRSPTDVEVDLMREARTKLALLCQGLAPKDIVATEAIAAVIEDLGLNAKAKDQRLGFRAPKMSIAERYSQAKWKMEESKKLSAPSTTFTSHPLQTSFSGTVDNRMPSQAGRMFAFDKSGQTTVSSTGTAVCIPAHVSAGAGSTALQYQSTGNQVRPPVVTGVMPNSHVGRNSASLPLPKVDHPQVKVDGGSNGSSYMLQVQANSSANQPLVNAPTWSLQTRSASENRVPALNSAKAEVPVAATVSRVGPQITTDQSFRPFITQAAPGNLSTVHQPLQGMNIIQPPSIPSHAEIAKIVQKLLQPKPPEHPTWTPPSRDYMNKALTCQTCELTMNEVDTVLLCDSCEKGFHLKCLQPSVLRGIHNRVDWYCMRCLSLSSGKPLPPKYGRVMRSSNTPPNLPSNTVSIQPSSEKKAGNLDPKITSQVLTTNGSSIPTLSSGNHNVEPPSDLKIPDMKDVQGTSISSGTETITEKPDPNNSMKSLGVSSSSKPCEDTKESETLPKLSDLANSKNLQSSQDIQVERTVSQDNAEKSSNKNSDIDSNKQKESHGGEKLTYEIKRDDQDVVLANDVGSSETDSEGRQHSALSSNSSHSVEWIGHVVQQVDEKKFYESCCVDGVTYRLQSHALFPSGPDKLSPSKLQSMWEDCKTGLKWVKVTKCYFPNDLPGNVGHPCVSEINEVYESNSERTEMASSIQGPCDVLPSDKFKQENDRRCQLGIGASASAQPIFLCRWFYDEVKNLFQPVTG